MRWISHFGFNHNPFDDTPPGRLDLRMFAGRDGEISFAQREMGDGGTYLFIEGRPGIGKTSLGNYLRFEKANRGICVTPDIEINGLGNPHGIHCGAITLLSAVKALEKGAADTGRRLTGIKDYRRIKRAALSMANWFHKHSAEILSDNASTRYHRFPLSTGETGDLLCLCADTSVLMGFKGGMVIQMRVGENTRAVSVLIKSLPSNDHITWILNGPPASGRYVARRFEKVSWLDLAPLRTSIVRFIVSKRLDLCSPHPLKKPPLSYRIPDYLHRVTDGDLSYAFHTCAKLLQLMSQDGLLDYLTLKQALGTIKRLAGEEIRRYSPTPLAVSILKRMSHKEFMSTGGLTHAIKKKQTSVSRALSELRRKGLASYHILGRHHLYSASSAAKVAYRE